MIKCNLSVLLAERNLKITQVSKDTGISRTTLTSLANNYSQGIQLDTLNKLCIYLQVTPEQFFSYIPFDVNIQGNNLPNQDMFNVEFTFREKQKKEFKVNLFCKTVIHNETFLKESCYNSLEEKQLIMPFDIFMIFFNPKDQPDSETALDIEKKNQLFIKYFKQMPIGFIRDLESDLINEALSCMGMNNPPDELSPQVIWPTELD